jgi:CheY-like chemotaxis protein
LILLVEDNHSEAMLIVRALQEHQVENELLVVNDGEAAIDIFELADSDRNAPCPELLLLDLNLTRRTGAEILEQVRNTSRCREMPVIVITSSGLPSDRAPAESLGAVEYFQKPMDLEEYMKIGLSVREALRKRSPESVDRAAR